jgi:hypothetical protein
MDLSENGKCLFTSMQYVESSHAPYQRIRFFFSWQMIFIRLTRFFEIITWCECVRTFMYIHTHKVRMSIYLMLSTGLISVPTTDCGVYIKYSDDIRFALYLDFKTGTGLKMEWKSDDREFPWCSFLFIHPWPPMPK